MTPQHYDTKEGIEAFLKRGLDGIHELAALRHEAGYVRKEPLTHWIVASYWSLDTSGNTMVITEGRPDYHTFKSYPPLVFDMAFYKSHAEDNRGFSSTFAYYPTSDEHCSRCLRGWDVDSAHDYDRYNRNDPPFHKECSKLEAIDASTEWFKGLLDQAIYYTKLVSIPNGYSKGSNEPWFLVHTPYGPIKIGWRKRVISIHWDQADGLADRNGREIFAEDATTSDKRLVHAWGKDKAIEYLRRLVPPPLDQIERAL